QNPQKTLKTYKAVTTQPLPLGDYLNSYQLGGYVMVKTHKAKNMLQPKWKGPIKVLLCTYSAFKAAGKETWIHHSQVKAAPNTVTSSEDTPPSPVSEKNVVASEDSRCLQCTLCCFMAL
uniref:Murine leukemia virus integrase C-terminal domain-containing protein n=1 Tax=Dromaius novaehollandiae TaxID=8790 RepID=A0A8C4JQK7_DRONO